MKNGWIARSGAMLMAATLVACGQAPEPPREPDEATRLSVAEGEMVGFVAENGAHVWRAVPYAAPPVGDLRWRAPRPAEAYTALHIATEFGPRCPQITNEFAAAEGLEVGALVGSEDCLTLDVYAPPNAEGLPVMLWIHGGGNVWGASSSYDGSKLAVEQNVVLMAVQYRLGPLGWFSHPGLHESGEIAADAAVNFGLQDLVAALEWAGANAAAFGGDADNVTIFGESAGGHNVAGLLVNPAAEGLFDRAIIQSGLVMTVPQHVAETGEGGNPDDRHTFSVFDAGLSATELQAIPLADVFARYEDEDGQLTDLPRMIEDGVSIPDGGILTALATPGGFHAVPVITGANRDETKLYAPFTDGLTDSVGPMIWPRNRDTYDAWAEYPSRLWRARAVDDVAQALRSAGHEDVWAYRFDWDEGGSILVSDTAVLLGASHAMEIPFVFNHFELFGAFDSVLFNDRNREGRAALAAEMGGYWGEFARAGAPGDAWQRWGEGGRLMRFDTDADGGSGMITGVETAEGILTSMAADTRLSTEMRCDLRDTMTVFPGLDPQMAGQMITCP